MLLLMIERGMPIDIVLTADTGMEFPEMYDHLAKLDEYLYRERGIHLTMLRHPKGFEYMMFEEEKQKISSIENRQKLGVPLYGNGWPGVRVRWCTGQLKTHLIAKEVNRLKGKYSKARSGFNTGKIKSTTTQQLDSQKYENDSKEDFTLIKQLIVDINAQDNSEWMRLTRAGSSTTFNEFEHCSKMFRFEKAFNDFFDIVRFKGIDDTNKEEIKILFEKHGKDISVDSLSTGEKQVVFRGAHLLKNSNSMVGGVVLLDEPELSMHPKWQQKVLEYYRSLFTAEGVQNAQMIFATHSEYVLNSALNDRDNVLIITLTDDNGIIQAKNITAPSTLPTITSAETNYLAFGVVSPDYHIELYGWLQNKAQKLSIKSCDDYISNCSEFVPMEHTKQYLHTDRNGRTTVYQTLPTFIRNSIDHPDSGYSYTENELRKSIELLIKLCR